MNDNKQHFTSISVIPELDNFSINEARNLFFSYKNKGVIRHGLFDEDLWFLCDDYANITLDFNLDSTKFSSFGKYIGVTEDDYKMYMKAFLMYHFGSLSLGSLQKILHCMKNCFLTAKLTNYPSSLSSPWIARYLSDFFSLFPGKEEDILFQDILEQLDNAVDMACVSFCQGRQRSLANFESYFRFDDLLNDFWQNSVNEEEKLFFFPIWFWWNVSAILPLRPREIVLTPRKCLKQMNGEMHLIVRKNNIKGSQKKKSYKISKDYKTASYPIPENIEKEIRWYLNKTDHCCENELDTLFTTSTHYWMWERSTPYNSRYFTYINLKTCLRYFYEIIISKRYKFHILDITDEMVKTLQENEIERLHLGDTRHIAMINMIVEGATPVVSMLLAGHDNMETSAHYFSNITTLIECKTYRQYKKQLNGKQQYTISSTHFPLSTKDFTLLDDGNRCFSPKIKEKDFSDCYKVSGPAGEIGFCKNCVFHSEKDKLFVDNKEFYQNQINQEYDLLQEIVKKIRKGKGEQEEINRVLLRLKDDCYSYAQYCKEKLEGE